MNKKEFFALTFIYEACDGNSPYATTIGVSDDKEKLIKKMQECAEEDCMPPNEDEDEWDDTLNFEVYEKTTHRIILRHRKREELYIEYFVQEVEFI